MSWNQSNSWRLFKNLELFKYFKIIIIIYPKMVGEGRRDWDHRENSFSFRVKGINVMNRSPCLPNLSWSGMMNEKYVHYLYSWELLFIGAIVWFLWSMATMKVVAPYLFIFFLGNWNWDLRSGLWVSSKFGLMSWTATCKQTILWYGIDSGISQISIPYVS